MQIGSPGRALPVPDATPELKMRAIKIPREAFNAIRPVDMNVVFQHDELSDDNSYDLVIGTNIFVYYSGFEQALALRNLSQMIRPGGFLLSNNLLLFSRAASRSGAHTFAAFKNRDGNNFLVPSRLEIVFERAGVADTIVHSTQGPGTVAA